MRRVVADGTCSVQQDPTLAPVSFPGIIQRPPLALDTPNLRISGPNLDLTGDLPGQLVVDGMSRLVFPIAAIDCLSGCGTWDAGWYETLLWSEGRQQACFAIFYLHDDDTVTVGFDICLPGVESLAGDDMPTATNISGRWCIVR